MTWESVVPLQSNNTHPINNVDKFLIFLASKAPRESNTGRGVYERSDDRNELGHGSVSGGRCQQGVLAGEWAKRGSYEHLEERVVARPSFFRVR